MKNKFISTPLILSAFLLLGSSLSNSAFAEETTLDVTSGVKDKSVSCQIFVGDDLVFEKEDLQNKDSFSWTSEKNQCPQGACNIACSAKDLRKSFHGIPGDKPESDFVVTSSGKNLQIQDVTP